MYQPNGILVAMVTPMNNDESINEMELRNQVNRYIKAGIHGIFCLGTNGEFYALNAAEKLKVMEIVLDENRGRVPVCAGTGCITTKETILLSKKAREMGMDAVSLITPYFTAVSQQELYEHYRVIAGNVDIPIILYNIPARTNINIDYMTAKRLSVIPNIIGLKDSSGNFDNILRYIEETDEHFSVLSGNDSLILWTLMAGGKGGISGIANLFPELMVSIYELWKKGKFADAKIAQDSLRPIRDTLKLANPNSVVKKAMNLMGYPVGPARSPASASGTELEKILMEVLKGYQKP